jgi:death-on-curing protein
VTIYPAVEDVLETHQRLIDLFGGTVGLRDRGALEAALSRPQSGYYSDLIEEAAALWESLSQNHPFVDGNKRVAVTVAAAFLRINGYTIQFEDRAAFEFLVALYESGRFEYSELEAWLRSHAEIADK